MISIIGRFLQYVPVTERCIKVRPYQFDILKVVNREENLLPGRRCPEGADEESGKCTEIQYNERAYCSVQHRNRPLGRTKSNISARVPHPTSLRSATFPSGEGNVGAAVYHHFNFRFVEFISPPHNRYRALV